MNNKITVKDSVSLLLLLILALFLYAFFAPYYRLSNNDEPWFLSYFYNLVNNNEIYNVNFGGSLNFFSHYGSYLYGYILNLIGWTKGNGQAISTILFLLSCIMWFFISVKLKFTKIFSYSLFLLMLVIEPFFGMAHQIRIDSLVFFTGTLSFFLFINNRFFFSTLFLTFAIESHPIGVVFGFYYIAYFIAYPDIILGDKKVMVKRVALLSAGFIVGVILYLLLHYKYLGVSFVDVLNEGVTSLKAYNALYVYFFKTKYYRHIPELIVLLGSLSVFVYTKQYKSEKRYFFVFVFTIAVTVASILIPRGNFHYTPFFYIAYLMLIISVFEKYGKIWLLNIGIFLFLLPQYGYLYVKMQDFPGIEPYVKSINSLYEDDGTIIYGDTNAWFAFIGKDNFRNLLSLDYIDDIKGYIDSLDYDRFYIIGAWVEETITIDKYLEKFSYKYDCNIVKSKPFYDTNINLWECKTINKDSK